MIRFSTYLLLVIFFTSCLTEIEFNGVENVTGTLVIEGGVTSEYARQAVRLGRTQKVTGTRETNAVSGAVVFVHFDNQQLEFLEVDSIPGFYVSDSVQLESEKEYFLEVTVDGDIYEASDYMFEGLPFDPISYEPIPEGSFIFGDNNEGFYLIPLPGNFGGGRSFIYYLEINVPKDWQDNFPYPLPPRYIENPPSYNRSDTSYLIHPSLEISALFEYGKTEIWGFPLGTQLKERQYRLSPNFYEYQRSVLLETDWRGVNFLQAVPANVPSNISNGALGFFSALDYYEVNSIIQE